MALPSSGQLSFSQIATELGYIGPDDQLSLTSMSTDGSINADSPSKPDGVAPHSVSEWYGYDHSYTPTPDPPTLFNAVEFSSTRCDLTWENGGNTTDPLQAERFISGAWQGSPFAISAGLEAHQDNGYTTSVTKYRLRFNGAIPSDWVEAIVAV